MKLPDHAVEGVEYGRGLRVAAERRQHHRVILEVQDRNAVDVFVSHTLLDAANPREVPPPTSSTSGRQLRDPGVLRTLIRPTERIRYTMLAVYDCKSFSPVSIPEEMR